MRLSDSAGDSEPGIRSSRRALTLYFPTRKTRRTFSHMENQEPVSDSEVHEALAALVDVREANVKRLQRPRRYWIMVGLFLAVFALIPLTRSWPPIITFSVTPALLIVIAVFASWKQPSAVRNIKLTGKMRLPLVGFALLAGIMGGLNTALYNQLGWWWLPPLVAALLFTLAVVGGPLIDRYWARVVSDRVR